MHIKITRATVATEGFVKVGQVIDLPEAEARMLIAIHKAVPVDDVEPEPEVLDTTEAAPLIDSEAPKAKRVRRAK
jgi:hypothetical protein